MRDERIFAIPDPELLEWFIQMGKVLDRDPKTVEWNAALAKQLEASRAETVRDALIEVLLKVRSKDRGLVALRLNRAQREYSEKCGKRNIVLKARQLGITTYVAARYFIQTITQPGTLSLQVSHDRESTQNIFRIVHRFWENLPEEARHGALRTSRSSVRQIVFPRLDSEYCVGTAGDVDVGRGRTVTNLHCSEVARWRGDPLETLTSLRATVPEDGDIALESTPKGTGGVFYEEWKRADETGYVRHFFPWWYEEAYQVKLGFPMPESLTDEEQELVERAKLSLEQIEWRRRQHAQMRDMALQEFAEDEMTCFRTSGDCVFDLESIEKASRAAVDTKIEEDNRRLKIWFEVQPGKEYVVGVDPAGGGTEGDYSVAEVIDRETGLQCAEVRGHFPPADFATRLKRLGDRYNNALLVVERNNHGGTVLTHLRNRGYANIFCQDGKDGWLTSTLSRPTMLADLADILVLRPEQFQSEHLLDEFRTFVRRADGNGAAQSGTHDDCVMAMAIAFAGRKVGAVGSWQLASHQSSVVSCQ